MSYLFNILKDPNRKSLLKMTKEILQEGYKWKCIPYHYFTRFAFRKDVNPNSFIPNQVFDNFLSYKNLDQYKYLINDKVVFFYILDKFKKPQPKTIGSCFNGLFTIIDPKNRNKEQSISEKGFLQFFEYIFTHSNVKDLFIKRVDGSWGKDAFILNHLSYKENQMLCKQLENGYWIIQERIVQHPILSQINSSSLNTIRIDTILDDENKPEVISALLRFGIKDSIVDNVSAGGFFVGIEEDGRLKKTAYSFLKTGGQQIMKHLDSNVVFENIQLPYWNDVINLVLNLAIQFPQIKAIGWDIALTEKGPIVVEANNDYHIGMSEIASGGYLKNEKFAKHFKDFRKKIK